MKTSKFSTHYNFLVVLWGPWFNFLLLWLEMKFAFFSFLSLSLSLLIWNLVWFHKAIHDIVLCAFQRNESSKPNYLTLFFPTLLYKIWKRHIINFNIIFSFFIIILNILFKTFTSFIICMYFSLTYPFEKLSFLKWS